jgi:hypothetical protein
VRGIAKKFESLNPYCRDIVPGSVLKVEDVNFDPVLKEQRTIYCFAISAKRYALFSIGESGEPILLKKDVNNKDNGWKEHRLGHL